MYELLSGKLAFPGAMPGVLVHVREREPAPLAVELGLVPALVGIVNRCLAKKPERRFASTRDLVAALHTVPEPKPVSRFAPNVRRASPRGRAYGLNCFRARPVNSCVNSIGEGKKRLDPALLLSCGKAMRLRRWRTELRLRKEPLVQWSNESAAANIFLNG